MNTKAKVLFLLHLPPPVHGSSMVGQYVKDSQVINDTFDCYYINLGTSRSIDEIGKNPLLKIWRYFSIITQLLKQLLTNKPHLCYLAIKAKGPGFYKDALVALLAKLFGVHIVYHFHNKGVSTSHHKLFDNTLYRKVFRNSHAILLSKYLYPDIAYYFPKEMVQYCPNGIPNASSVFQNINRKKQEERNRTVEILFLSNLIESKGVFVLLEACKILHSKQIPFHCTFVGGEGNITASEFNKKVNEFGLENHLIYAGKKYGIEKTKIFSTADIFVHPTYEDCFPLVLLEAMQCSLPVVSTLEGGIRSIVDENKTGYLVPQLDVLTLAEKLEKLISNPNLRIRMGKTGREKYEQQFTLNKFENCLGTILNNIINEHDNQ